jgi:ParB-like chromosome segregation protein Spo0J
MPETPDLAPTRSYTKSLPITALYEDPAFSGLFLQEHDVIVRMAAEMKHQGFDPYRPIDVWKDGRGRGKHIVLDGHQRLAAARKAGLTEVYVAYREPASRLQALLWAANQQGLRRNISREVQCLSILRALADEPEYAYATTRERVAKLRFASATIDRARLLLKHGTQAEVTEVLEGTHGLRDAYELMNQRRRKKARVEDRPIQRVPKRPPVLTALRDALAKVIDGGLLELAEALRHARWLLDYLEGRAPDAPEADEEDDA